MAIESGMCQVGLTTMVFTTPSNSGVSVTWVLPTTTFELQPGRPSCQSVTVKSGMLTRR